MFIVWCCPIWMYCMSRFQFCSACFGLYLFLPASPIAWIFYYFVNKLLYCTWILFSLISETFIVTCSCNAFRSAFYKQYNTFIWFNQYLILLKIYSLNKHALFFTVSTNTIHGQKVAYVAKTISVCACWTFNSKTRSINRGLDFPFVAIKAFTLTGRFSTRCWKMDVAICSHSDT